MFSKITIVVCLTLLSTIVAMEEQKVQLESGQIINYLIHGNSGKLIVLLSGTLCCIKQGSFTELIEDLSQENTVMQIDLPGFGDSTPHQRDYSGDFYDTDANVVIEFVKSLGIVEYSLLGFGHGATVALYVAAKEPKSVKQLVVWGGKVKITDEVLATANKLADLKEWDESIFRAMRKIYDVRYIKRVMKDLARAFQNMRNDDGEEFCADKLSKVEAKTLVLHGTNNGHVAQEHSEYIKENVQNGDFEVIENGTHALHEAPEFNPRVLQFINSN